MSTVHTKSLHRWASAEQTVNLKLFTKIYSHRPATNSTNSLYNLDLYSHYKVFVIINSQAINSAPAARKLLLFGHHFSFFQRCDHNPVIYRRASGFCSWGFLSSALSITGDIVFLLTSPWILSFSWSKRRRRVYRARSCWGRGAIQRK